MTDRPFASDPISNVQWLACDTLSPNLYNPNVVFDAELRLLELSILATGWVQLILVSRALTIIDGFHRWSLAKQSKAMLERYGAQVPCAVLDVDEAHAKLITVRINRAKGSHVAARMSDLVKSLIDEHGLLPEEVAVGIGAHRTEVDLLYQDSIFKARNLDKASYSRAWVPAESTTEPGAGKPARARKKTK